MSFQNTSFKHHKLITVTQILLIKKTPTKHTFLFRAHNLVFKYWKLLFELAYQTGPETVRETQWERCNPKLRKIHNKSEWEWKRKIGGFLLEVFGCYHATTIESWSVQRKIFATSFVICGKIVFTP